ncbi:MAG: hypothetical protein RLZZ244_607, partial [Verrucomicrobiota bacterium]
SALASVLVDLRTLLAERFPSCAPPPSPQGSPQGSGFLRASDAQTFPTGIPAWDQLTRGLRMGELTEICGSLGGCSLLLQSLLEAVSASGWTSAWIDAGGTLNVADWPPPLLRRLLWVRPPNPLAALKAADLLLRDGNLSWVILDLLGLPPSQLRRLPAQHWHRFHRLAAQRQNPMLVLTPTPLVEGVRVRVRSEPRLSLQSLLLPRKQLQRETAPTVFLRGHFAPTSFASQHRPAEAAAPSQAIAAPSQAIAAPSQAIAAPSEAAALSA